MIDERMEELASLYALDLLEGDEKASFENLLRQDAALRELVRDLRAAATALAISAPTRTPPSRLRNRILQKIRKQDAPGRILAFPQWIPWALAACLMIFCGVLVRERADFQKQIAALSERDAMSSMKLAMLSSQMEGAPRAVALACWDCENGRGLLTAEKLPQLNAGQDYQIWVIDPASGKPVSGGVFSVDNEGNARISFRPDHAMGHANNFAVSIERKGGAPQPQGKIVLTNL